MHLFLEGPIQTGKSTLLREYLRPHMSDLGGFSSQRLLDQKGHTIAFRIVPACDMRLAIPYENTPETIFRTINTAENKPAGKNNLQVFENIGMKYLTENPGKKLILLDEIGGAELLCDKFRNALYTLLKGNIPCIGVVKSKEKASSMSSASNPAGSILSHNIELRQIITEQCNGKIISFKRNDLRLHAEITDFLDNIF